MALDLKKYEKLAKQKHKTHLALLDKIDKNPPKNLEEKAQQQTEKAFEKIDCLECANCCKTIGPLITQEDLKPISEYLNLSVKEFLEKYIEMDEDGDFIFNQSPCPFLKDDNYCQIYDVRPKACKGFPHTDGKSFKDAIDLSKINQLKCPIVFEVLEGLENI